MPNSHATEGESLPAETQDARHAELEERNAQLEDRYKRALADLDNYRKRTARETAQMAQTYERQLASCR